ncbi:hypothetical protein [Flavobacterium flavipallidum]|uniref:Capsular polysaccharide synthesis protein n=1 Tax=Flavobacterium flavipallidum TaxID=3139140 RepID=A0ABU9HJ64_9FLAO
MKVCNNYRKVANRVTIINYSNEFYTQAQKKNTQSALRIGKVKKVISYNQNDIDELFYLKNKHILEQKRGGGYWIWKPYIIRDALLNMQDGEYLFYCDSGSVFVNSIDSLIGCFDMDFDIMPFELQHIESKWTKRDCFKLLGCDGADFFQTNQIQATFSLWRKSEFSLKFVEEWLKFAQDDRIVTDIENQLGFPNYEGFVEHRHDQSIFSLLIKKYKVKVHRDPSQYGNKYLDFYPHSNYPQLFFSTRQRNLTIYLRMKKTLEKNILFRMMYSFVRKKRNRFVKS